MREERGEEVPQCCVALSAQKGAAVAPLTSSQVHAAAAAGELLPAVFGQNQRFSLPPARHVFLVRHQDFLVSLINVINLGSSG